MADARRKTRLADLPFVEPADRDEWRAWLADNHDSSGGVWLALGKKGTDVTELRYDDAVEEALCFGWIDSTVRRIDADRFKQLFTPRRPGSTWSRSNKERVERMRSASLMTPAGEAAIERAKADGSWTLLDDVDALVVPAELADALADDAKARSGFNELAESDRKRIIYWIMTAKRAETKARRVSETLEAAREGRPPRG